MRLSQLMRHMDGVGSALSSGVGDPDIASIHYRSQDVRPGGLFVAIRGLAADGHTFIDDAFSRGACAVVAQNRVSEDERIIRVPDSRLALAQLASAFFSDPSSALTLVGVTGTNGKTTVTYLVESILAASDLSTGVVGTNNCRYAGEVFDSTVTTPESIDLHRMMADMKAKGVTHAVMEVSSHGVDLKRVASCRFSVGAFTNLTQDHLDYHRTMEDYWNCKKRFFTDYLPSGSGDRNPTAVINMDNGRGRELCNSLLSIEGGPEIIAYGRDSGHDVFARGITIDISGIRGAIATPGGDVSLQSRLVGAHNLENILCAAAIAVALELPLSAVEKGIGDMTNVPGRLERVDDSGERIVFVDYAHTPDALDNVLRTLRDLCRRRLICVFGCGGDRDRGKRPLMGKIAGALCDVVVVTSDNPRTETPDDIIDEILPGVREEMDREMPPGVPDQWNGEKGFVVVSDRAEAIRTAVRMAGPEDVVLIAGKGHETYQKIGREKRDFDDRRVAAEALGNTVREGVKGQG